MNTAYRSSSRDYLQRAGQLLNNNNADSLFYAAFELRCGIEARLTEYLEVAEGISEKKKQGWKIAELAKNLERVFRLGNKIVQLKFEDVISSNRCTIFHTPVTSELRKNGQHLGNYLHTLKTHRKPNDPWWDSFKLLLDETFTWLALATKGTLLGPPLLPPNGKGIKTSHELGIEPAVDEVMKAICHEGKQVRLEVKYLDNLPSGNK